VMGGPFKLPRPKDQAKIELEQRNALLDSLAEIENFLEQRKYLRSLSIEERNFLNHETLCYLFEKIRTKFEEREKEIDAAEQAIRAREDYLDRREAELQKRETNPKFLSV
jgi:predicted NAD/FAD-binding protein